ncbi:MAG: DUF4198 domain-containing protein [Tannerellaceae bacterium]|nr:DUF4198 domain-containing protein [Tannerellaceae bacterium]
MEFKQKTKNLFGILLLFLCTISLASCQKEEWDIEKIETKESTVLEGMVITSDGMPLANVEVKVDYSEDKWLAYNKTRHKAETKTDKNGKYRLFFYKSSCISAHRRSGYKNRF